MAKFGNNFKDGLHKPTFREDDCMHQRRPTISRMTFTSPPSTTEVVVVCLVVFVVLVVFFGGAGGFFALSPFGGVCVRFLVVFCAPGGAVSFSCEKRQ